MKQIGLLFLVLVGVMLATYWLMQPGNSDRLKAINFNSGTLAPTNSKAGDTIKVGSTAFKVEIAKTEQDRQIGLSKHTSLERDTSLLFVFDQKNIRPDFWMKGMSFPIDIIWINDGKVAQITPEVPTARQGVSDDELPRYSPSMSIDYVLEVASGVSKEKNIKVGDAVEFPKF